MVHIVSSSLFDLALQAPFAIIIVFRKRNTKTADSLILSELSDTLVFHFIQMGPRAF